MEAYQSTRRGAQGAWTALVISLLVAFGCDLFLLVLAPQAGHAAQRETGSTSVAFGNSSKCDGDCLVALARDAEASGEFRVFLKPGKRIELIRWLRKPTGKVAPKYTWLNSAVPRERDLKEELQSQTHKHGQPHPADPRVIARALENGSYTILVFYKQNEKGFLEPTLTMEWILDWDAWTNMKERRDFVGEVIDGRESCGLHPVPLGAEGPCAEGLKDGYWRFFLVINGEKSETVEEGRYAKGRRMGRWREGDNWYIYENGLRRKVPDSKPVR